MRTSTLSLLCIYAVTKLPKGDFLGGSSGPVEDLKLSSGSKNLPGACSSLD